MRLTEARIKNFMGIEDWTLKFQPGFNLLKGENGTGKTSVLDALALGLGAFTDWYSQSNAPKFDRNNVRKHYLRQGDDSVSSCYQLPAIVAMEAEFLEEKKTFKWTRRQDVEPDNNASYGALDSDEIVTLSKKMVNTEKEILPAVRYLSVPSARIDGTADILLELVFSRPDLLKLLYDSSKNLIEDTTEPSEVLNRKIGYTNALSRLSDTQIMQGWCNQMEQIHLQKDEESKEYKGVMNAAVSFLEAMEPKKQFNVFYDTQLSALLCEVNNSETLPISHFSSGYQSLLWMVLEIAWRMSTLNPFLLDNIAQTPGVVLIDELDLHLHPKWQWRVIDALRTTFPNVQFIAATHAPILFASANDVWIVNLDGEEPSYQWSRYGLDIGTAVSEYQGDYTLPERVQKIAGEVSDAINREDYPEAKAKLEELEREVAPKPGENGGSVSLVDPPLLTELRARYDIESSLSEV